MPESRSVRIGIDGRWGLWVCDLCGECLDVHEWVTFDSAGEAVVDCDRAAIGDPG